MAQANTTNQIDGSWIAWAGGDCPVADGVPVEMLFRDNRSSKPAYSEHPEILTWQHRSRAFGGDIVAYRPASAVVIAYYAEYYEAQRVRMAGLLVAARAAAEARARLAA